MEFVDVIRFDAGVQLQLTGIDRGCLFRGQILLPTIAASHQFEDRKIAVLAAGSAVGKYGAEIPTTADRLVTAGAGRIDARPQATLGPVKQMEA